MRILASARWSLLAIFCNIHLFLPLALVLAKEPKSVLHFVAWMEATFGREHKQTKKTKIKRNSNEMQSE